MPNELKSAKFVQANSRLISGITKDGTLFSFNPTKDYFKALSKVKKYASSTAGLCAITGEQKLECYTFNLKPRDLHQDLKVKVQDVSMSDKGVCVSTSSSILCWDFYYKVTKHDKLNSKNVKLITNSNKLVCVVNQKSELSCDDISLGEFKVVVPKELQTNAKRVVAGVNSTAAINKKGELVFWWNYPMYHPDSVRKFEGFKKGTSKFSLSRNYFCSINDSKALNCYQLKPNTPRLAYVPVPKFMREGALDVSAGKEQICAVSSLSGIVCWKYTLSTDEN